MGKKTSYELAIDVGKKSLQEIIKSATQGYAPAQFILARRYMYGRDGLEQDINKAFDWFKKSAEQGYVFAVFDLSCMYNLGKIDGKGIRRDRRKAFFWIFILSKTHQATSEGEQEIIDEKFERMEKQLTEKQVKKIQEDAEKYMHERGLIKIK